MTSPVSLFLGGAHTVLDALSDSRVGQAWDQPSVLEAQSVGGLAGHLARGGVWVVGEYVEAGTPMGPADFSSAAEYFVFFAESARADDHHAIRERGVAVAAKGWHGVAEELASRLGVMTIALTSISPDRLVTVIGGKVMALGDYLLTRVVEQAVHLDDLARSIDADPWTLPDGHETAALYIGLETVRLRRGSGAVLRALYRRGFAERALPVF